MTERLRRLRLTPAMREILAECRVVPAQLMMPMFIVPGQNRREPIDAMPGIERLTPDEAVREARAAAAAGIRSILLFGVPTDKDPTGSAAASPDSPAAKAATLIKREFPEIVIAADVCLCGYTSHGHCGILHPDGTIANDDTVAALARMSITMANAGADIIAPSDMMDGRVKAIRDTLDTNAHQDTIIMSYSAKFASAMYGPFREAAASTPSHGDRKSHQLPPDSTRAALACVDRDIAEGADIVMVKPAGLYLDIIAAVRARTTRPVAAYMVSGEYSMLKAAARNGWIDEPRAATESLTAVHRAGADIIITYLAYDLARGQLTLS